MHTSPALVVTIKKVIALHLSPTIPHPNPYMRLQLICAFTRIFASNHCDKYGFPMSRAEYWKLQQSAVKLPEMGQFLCSNTIITVYKLLYLSLIFGYHSPSSYIFLRLNRSTLQPDQVTVCKRQWSNVKKCRPWSDCSLWAVWSGFTLFAPEHLSVQIIKVNVVS